MKTTIPATWTDAEVADYIATRVMDWKRHRVGSYWVTPTKPCVEFHGYVVGTQVAILNPLKVFDPCNVLKQALELFLSKHWPRRFAIVNANGLERTEGVAEDAEWIEVFDDDATGVVCRIEKKLHKHPVCRAIGVAVCVARGMNDVGSV